MPWNSILEPIQAQDTVWSTSHINRCTTIMHKKQSSYSGNVIRCRYGGESRERPWLEVRCWGPEEQAESVSCYPLILIAELSSY
jgi:hypothetical protein